jgi:hypothetical protein
VDEIYPNGISKNVQNQALKAQKYKILPSWMALH